MSVNIYKDGNLVNVSGGPAGAAARVTYNDEQSGLGVDDVQEAIDEISEHTIVYMTQAEYDALPDTKYSDGILRGITDAPSPLGILSSESVRYNNTTVKNTLDTMINDIENIKPRLSNTENLVAAHSNNITNINSILSQSLSDIDIRYNETSGKPEWKQRGADTWNPFNGGQPVYGFEKSSGLKTSNLSLSLSLPEAGTYEITLISGDTIEDGIGNTSYANNSSVNINGSNYPAAGFCIKTTTNVTITEPSNISVSRTCSINGTITNAHYIYLTATYIKI